MTIALAVLGIPPILTNTFVAIRQVDRAPVDAARGMGMSEVGVVTRVEVPLAVPTIMSGVRTAAINIVATATIAPLAGVLTLGDLILSRNVYGDEGVLAGAIVVALLALAVEFSLAALQRALTPEGSSCSARAGRKDFIAMANETTGGSSQRASTRGYAAALFALLAVLVCALAFAACGDDDERWRRQRRRRTGAADPVELRELGRHADRSAPRTSRSRSSWARSTPRRWRRPATRSKRTSTSARR